MHCLFCWKIITILTFTIHFHLANGKEISCWNVHIDVAAVHIAPAVDSYDLSCCCLRCVATQWVATAIQVLGIIHRRILIACLHSDTIKAGSWMKNDLFNWLAHYLIDFQNVFNTERTYIHTNTYIHMCICICIYIYDNPSTPIPHSYQIYKWWEKRLSLYLERVSLRLK